MTRNKRFTFLCNVDERYMLASLADKLQRSQSDTIRYFLRTAFQELVQQYIADNNGILEEDNKELKIDR